MDENSLLIDFNNSPAQKYNPLPLIPVPPQTTLIDVETCNDPFEVPEVSTGSLDPFESALKRACNSFTSEQTKENHSTPNNASFEEINKNSLKDENNERKEFSVKLLNTEGKCDSNLLSLRHNTMNNITENNKILPGSTISNCPDNKNIKSSICTLSSANVDDKMTNTAMSGDLQEDEESHLKITGDLSITEENIKTIIAKRVNKCIKQVLNGSLKINKQNGDNSLRTCKNKRSLSFVGLSAVSNTDNDCRLNKSFSDLNGTFALENVQCNTPDISSDSSSFKPLSPQPSEESHDGKTDEQVFKEALKLSRTFSKLAESFCLCEEPGPDSDDDDLLNCKPRWLYTADSSEDEEEKLRKDPKLNFRRRSDSSVFSSPVAQISTVPDSPALMAFKSRRSVTQLQINTSQDEIVLKRSNSFGGKSIENSPPETLTIPPIVSAVPVGIIKPDDQPIKLKKKIADVKKGPMRAVVPIQNMTKESFNCRDKQKPSQVKKSKQELSPDFERQVSNQIMGTPSKDIHMNITPVACSTPNKVENFGFNGKTSFLKPLIQVPSNKRHSFESNTGNHKSRSSDTDTGARPRSNSANSSIPRGMSVKPLKSTSNLPRSTNIQMNTQKVNVPVKKSVSQTKASFKSRVLTEVKTKSPHQNKVKAAVSTISNLVMGKSKKVATRDKENRVPV